MPRLSKNDTELAAAKLESEKAAINFAAAQGQKPARKQNKKNV
eukprot:SAG11_NODE_30924_length_296_cov_0.964467_1_plen_42_part_10